MFNLTTFETESPTVAPITEARARKLIGVGRTGRAAHEARAAMTAHAASGGDVFVWQDPYMADVCGETVYRWSPTAKDALAKFLSCCEDV